MGLWQLSVKGLKVCSSRGSGTSGCHRLALALEAVCVVQFQVFLGSCTAEDGDGDDEADFATTTIATVSTMMQHY